MYNHIDDDLRNDLDTKAELHQRVCDLRDRLWEITESRKREADKV